VAVSADGTRVLATGLDGALYEWDVSKALPGTVVRRPGPYPAEPGCTDIGPASIDSVRDGFVVVCTQIAVLEAATGLPRVPVIDLKSRDLTAFATDQIGRFVAVTEGFALQVRDTTAGTGTLPLVLALDQPPSQLAISDNGRIVAAATETQLMVVDPQSGRAIVPVITIPGGIKSVAITPDGSTIAIGQSGGTVVFLGTTHGRPPVVITVGAQAVRVRALAFSPDGKLLAIGTNIGRPALVATDTGRLVWRATVGHAGITTSLVFSSDMQTLVSGGSDARQLVYDLTNGDLLATFADGDPQWTFPTMLPDGRHLAVAALDGSIRIQELDPDLWIARACAIANRDMTAAEWSRLLPGRGPRPICPTS
jgi:WD40 repeat protein